MAYKPISGPDEFGHFDLEYVPVEVKLCNEDLTNPLWFEHPEFGPNVDVAAIDVSNLVAGLHLRHVNTLESDAVLDVTASQDLFVVGFPFGQMANAPAPIWKRGAVALDPTFDPDGVPKMLIDTATREGMSGSVVIARHIVAAREYPKKDGTKHSTLYARLDLVAGIYSGRNYPDLERAQLGIVWKRRVIEETIAGKKVASV